MKYVTAFGGDTGNARTNRRLEHGVSRATISEECRHAALSFMSGVAEGWDKVDVALWLTGPYARATRHAKHGERFPAAWDGREIPSDSLEQVVTKARTQLVASLEKAALQGGTLDFVEDVAARALVRNVLDAAGHDAWVPIDSARMRLRDRLRSLFVADYLNAPHEYEDLFVCHRCEAVVFDPHAKRRGICGVHRLSGAVDN